MSGHVLVQSLQIITLLGVALTAVKLQKTGLRRRYPVFFWYFCFRVVNSAWPLFLSRSSGLYYYLWVGTEAIDWVFYILVVRELCGLVLEKYQGLNTLGRWAIYAAMPIAGAISTVSVLPRLATAAAIQWKTMRTLVAADRGITLGLAIFLLMMMFLLKGYPVRLSRNVLLHATLYSIFFISNTLDSVLANVLGEKIYVWLDVFLMSVSAVCVLTWLFFLNPAGEDVKTTVPTVTSRHEERILSQLEALNATMLRISGK